MLDKKISPLGQKIEELREIHDITKKELCAAININKNTLINIEDGVLPNCETLMKIADFFKVSTDYLLGYTEVKERVTANIDKLYLSEPARVILAASKEYGHFISLLLENPEFRHLMREIMAYYNSYADELADVNKHIKATAKKNIDIIKAGSDKKPADIHDMDMADELNSRIPDVDKTKLTQFANQMSDIIADIKQVYNVDEHTRQRMKQISLSLKDISEEMMDEIKLKKAITPETFISVYIDELKDKKVLGNNDDTYIFLERTISSMMSKYI